MFKVTSLIIALSVSLGAQTVLSNFGTVPTGSITYTSGITGATAISQQAKNSNTISVTDFGATGNGSTDDTTAINAALTYAASNVGTKIVFPCDTTNNTYRITSTITIPSFTTLQGSNWLRCNIYYNPASNPGTVNTAFSLVGSLGVTIDGLRLQTGSTYPPSSVLEMGRTTGNGSAGMHQIKNSTIMGYATTAMIYAVSAETSIYENLYIEANGTTPALYGMYFSGIDDYSICSSCLATPQSNLSINVHDVNIISFTDPFIGIGDQIGGGTGDHYYRDIYIGLHNLSSSTSEGIRLISGAAAQSGPNTRVHVENIRVENGSLGLHFYKNSQTSISNVVVSGLTFATGYATTNCQYGDAGLTIANSNFQNNICNLNGGVTGTSSFDTLNSSTMFENYGAITVRTATDNKNTLVASGSGSFVLPSGSYFNTYQAPFEVNYSGSHYFWVDGTGHGNFANTVYTNGINNLSGTVTLGQFYASNFTSANQNTGGYPSITFTNSYFNMTLSNLTELQPGTTNAMALGDTTHAYTNLFLTGLEGQTVGAAIASGTTVAPVARIHHITGTTAITTITAPAAFSSTIGGCLTLIADGAWSTGTSGNIANAVTAVANTQYTACWDGTKWYIK